MPADLKVVPLEPKAKKEHDTSTIVAYLEELLAKAKEGEVTGVALVWACARNSNTATWWGSAPGSGHLNDLGAGITRLSFRYQNEAYDDAVRAPEK